MAKKREVKRPTSRDPLQVQIAITAKLPKGLDSRQLKASLFDDAIKYRLENDEDHPAFITKIVRWKNPARKGSNGRWRQGNQADAWSTLGKWIRFATVDVVTVRHRPRGRR